MKIKKEEGMADSTGEKKMYGSGEWYRFWGKSERELNGIITDCKRKLAFGNPGLSEKLDLERSIAVATDVLAEKMRRREVSESVKKYYNTAVEQAYNNLRAAYTPNGQLVFSILEEEDGQTAEEIRGWYEELMFLDDEEYSKLLDDLEKDEVIYKKSDKFYRLRGCEENLTFRSHQDYKDWIKKKWDYIVDKDTKKRIGDYDKMVDYIPLDRPFYKERGIEEVNFVKSIYDSNPDDFDDNDNIVRKYVKRGENYVYMAKLHLVVFFDNLAEAGFLTKHEDYYYVPLLGEKNTLIEWII